MIWFNRSHEPDKKEYQAVFYSGAGLHCANANRMLLSGDTLFYIENDITMIIPFCV